MEALELLSDPSITRKSQAFRERAAALPQPFQYVIHFVSNAPIEQPSLFESDGRPFAAVVQRPNEIVIMDLLTNQLSSIKCPRIPAFDNAVSTYIYSCGGTQLIVVTDRSTKFVQYEFCQNKTRCW